MQHTVYVSDVIDSPIAAVWNVMRDFNSLSTYHPLVMTSHIENNQTGDVVGCIRHLTFETGFVREKLVMLDDVAHAFSYTILEGTLPVLNYIAGVRLHPITNSNRTFCEWWADFDVIDGDRNALIEFIGQNVFQVGFQSVGIYRNSSRPPKLNDEERTIDQMNLRNI